MTAEELIEELEKLPPDTRIFVKGYEGGYADVRSPGEPSTYCVGLDTPWYYGDHEKRGGFLCGDDDCDHETVQGVQL